ESRVTSNTLHKAQTGKRERPKDSHPLLGSSSCPLPGNSNNTKSKPQTSNGHKNANNGKFNCTYFQVSPTQGNPDKGKAWESNKHKSAPNNHQPWVDLLGKTKGKYLNFLKQEKRVSFWQKGKGKA
ncbi:hypothetical protein DSO57_1023415, partial [Entomophthora muscae]